MKSDTFGLFVDHHRRTESNRTGVSFRTFHLHTLNRHSRLSEREEVGARARCSPTRRRRGRGEVCARSLARSPAVV